MTEAERIAKLEEKVRHLEGVLLASLHRMMRRELDPECIEFVAMREQRADIRAEAREYYKSGPAMTINGETVKEGDLNDPLWPLKFLGPDGEAV